jgi:hypothetical protein
MIPTEAVSFIMLALAPEARGVRVELGNAANKFERLCDAVDDSETVGVPEPETVEELDGEVDWLGVAD